MIPNLRSNLTTEQLHIEYTKIVRTKNEEDGAYYVIATNDDDSLPRFLQTRRVLNPNNSTFYPILLRGEKKQLEINFNAVKAFTNAEALNIKSWIKIVPPCIYTHNREIHRYFLFTEKQENYGTRIRQNLSLLENVHGHYGNLFVPFSPVTDYGQQYELFLKEILNNPKYIIVVKTTLNIDLI